MPVADSLWLGDGRAGGWTMDAKLLLLIALLAPILMVAAGIFAHAEKDPASLQPEQ